MIDLRTVVAVPKVAETKKISVISDFKKGERFTGRVVALSEDKTNVTIKLKDGLEFVAKLDIPLKDILEGNVSFEVDGFEEGKLKLKIIKNDLGPNNKFENNSLEAILSKLSLDKSKKPMIESMIKFNIPLTKENIDLLNGLFDFKDKIVDDSELVDKFINKYLVAKNINPLSEEAKEISSKLKDFFNEFKDMENKDLFMFLENDIDLTKENIKSYNNVFKEECGAYKSLMNLDSKLKLEDKVQNIDFKMLDDFNEYVSEKKIDLANIDKIQINELISKVTGKEVELSEEDINILKENLKNIDSIKKDELGAKINNSLDNLLSLNKNILNGKENLVQIKENLSQFMHLEDLDADNYTSLKKGIADISKAIDNFEKLNNNSISSLKHTLAEIKDVFVKVETSNLNQTATHTKLLADLKPNAKDNIDIFLKNLSEVKKSMSDTSEQMKSVIKSIANKVVGNDIASEHIFNTLKTQINDFKILNSVSNDYYYLDIPVDIRDDKYPCKLIIKDDRREGKRLDSKNLKLVLSIKTINMGMVDALIKVNDKKLQVDINVEEESLNFVEKKSKVLEKTLEQLGFIPYIFVRKQNKKENDISNYREFFNDSNSVSLDRMV